MQNILNIIEELILADDFTLTGLFVKLFHYGIPAAMHLFPSGGHGWAGHDDYRYAEPAKRAIADWLEIQKDQK